MIAAHQPLTPNRASDCGPSQPTTATMHVAQTTAPAMHHVEKISGGTSA